MTLNDVQKTSRCRVSRVTAGGMLGQRLSDMGFCPGTDILFVRRAPLQDPIHVQIGTHHVALRRNEARFVELTFFMPVNERGTCNGYASDRACRTAQLRKIDHFQHAHRGTAACGQLPRRYRGKKSGSFVRGETRVELVDLPRTYSLASWSPEEMAARQFILDEDTDLIVAVLDASTLEKSLYLCLQLLEMQRPLMAALNMTDVAEKRGIHVDVEALSQTLGVPVIRTRASRGIGRRELYDAITGGKGVPGKGDFVQYGELEAVIGTIAKKLPEDGGRGYPIRWLAIKLLEGDALAGEILAGLEGGKEMARFIEEQRESWQRGYDEDMARIAFILDRVFHRFGLHGQSTLPLILGGVYVGGCAIPGVIATRAIPDERARMATIMIVPMMNCLAKVPLYLLLVGAFFSDHAGWAMFFIGTVTLLMGLIVAKILSLTLLRGRKPAPFIIELPIYHMPSVYGVARQTFDRIWMFLQKIGSVVVAVAVIIFVLISFPNLSDERLAHYEQQRKALEQQFMAAVEKTSFAGQLTPDDIVPLLLYQEALREEKRGLSQDEANAVNTRALKENSVYAAIALRQGKDGKALAGALRKIDGKRKTLRREMRQERFEDSFLGRAGKALEGVTAGAGFTWRINVALLSALAAKENSAATLGAIYGLDGVSIGEGMASVSGFTPLHALALMLFMSLYPPCVPAAIMVKTQTFSTRWMIFSILFQMSVGLMVATLVFSGGTWLGLSGFEAMWAYYGLCLCLLLVLATIPERDMADEPHIRVYKEVSPTQPQ